ncbi:hypothetical protein E4U43_008233 [Claviceps pusilla]|uniref:Uncharacterized protein n=1 Tax=Claviceps pusilla TaxID=123648 RepID=A0A9P7NDF1_9HYPO|nr:hypothetical protein E4U43_008233 [Claviceps pusilla]
MDKEICGVVNAKGGLAEDGGSIKRVGQREDNCCCKPLLAQESTATGEDMSRVRKQSRMATPRTAQSMHGVILFLAAAI